MQMDDDLYEAGMQLASVWSAQENNERRAVPLQAALHDYLGG